MATSLDEQLNKYLADAQSIEEQALQQLREAPEIAGDAGIRELFRRHLEETEEHERLVRERLVARGASPSKLKEAVMRAGGEAFVLFARSQPDTPGKLVAHAYSYEHLEIAAYELLLRVALRAGDHETAAVARRILQQEQAMAARLEAAFELAVEASLAVKESSDLEEELRRYLADAHAIEKQAEQLLERGREIVGDDELSRIFGEHLAETREHGARLERRLEALGGSPSALQDAAMKLGALAWGAFFQAQPDTPGKLCAFAFAFEHLELGGQEQLLRVARRAGDDETAAVVEAISAEERAMARRLAGAFDRAVERSLEAVGTGA